MLLSFANQHKLFIGKKSGHMKKKKFIVTIKVSGEKHDRIKQAAARTPCFLASFPGPTFFVQPKRCGPGNEAIGLAKAFLNNTHLFCSAQEGPRVNCVGEAPTKRAGDVHASADMLRV